MEILIIINYETKLDITITKKHIATTTILLILFIISIKTIPILLCDPFTDEIDRILIKPNNHIPSRTLYDIYIKDLFEAFKLKLQLDNIPEREAIKQIIEKYPIKVYPMPR